MGKKVMEKEKRSKEKNWRGKSHTYRYYSNAAALSLRFGDALKGIHSGLSFGTWCGVHG
jgi:hypothetical protein